MITNTQLLLAVSIPTLVALIGIVWNNVALQSFRTEARAEMAEIRTIFSHMVDRHINHEGRISTVEERTKPK